MKVGDLIKHKPEHANQTIPCRGLRLGIIIERGVYVGRRDVTIAWDDGKIFTAQSKRFEVINED